MSEAKRPVLLVMRAEISRIQEPSKAESDFRQHRGPTKAGNKAHLMMSFF